MAAPILFHSLPSEIHLKILQHIDNNGFHNLTATNKYFRSLPSDQLNRYDLLYTEYHDPEWFEGRSILPCSICLKVVDQDDCWALHQGVWEFVLAGGLWEAHSLCWGVYG
jgi:hypothetical protein